jgi:hypothetical protein
MAEAEHIGDVRNDILELIGFPRREPEKAQNALRMDELQEVRRRLAADES